MFYSTNIKLYVIFKLKYWAERFPRSNHLLLSGDLICVFKLALTSGWVRVSVWEWMGVSLQSLFSSLAFWLHLAHVWRGSCSSLMRTLCYCHWLRQHWNDKLGQNAFFSLKRAAHKKSSVSVFKNTYLCIWPTPFPRIQWIRSRQIWFVSLALY